MGRECYSAAQASSTELARIDPRPPIFPVAGGSDEVLAAYLAATEARGLTLYPAQEEALLALSAGDHVILETPTGSGKSWVGNFAAYLALCMGRRAVYTCPVKALVNEKFFDLAALFGPEQVGMITGEAQVNPRAPIVACTQEILAQMSLEPAWARREMAAILDEFHYYGDPDRGSAWQLPLLCLARAQFLLMSATLGPAPAVVQGLAAHNSGRVTEVRGAQRPVPLAYRYLETPLHESLPVLVAAEAWPIYVVTFGQRDSVELAQSATSLNLTPRARKQAIAEELGAFRFDSPFGKDLKRLLTAGIGLHHAGMLPKYRRLVEQLAQAGRLTLVVGTDTLGVGINIPIRTVLFTRLTKFDGTTTRVLSVRDFRQIAGRAGRAGFDHEGLVAAQAPEHVIENRRLASRQAEGTRKSKQLRKRPPPKHFVAWDQETFARLQQAPVEPLTSRFQVTYPMLLALLGGDPAPPGPYRRLVTIVGGCHETPPRRRRLLGEAARMARALREAEVVRLHVRPLPARLELNAGLQENFSLDEALGLFLLDALPQLDAAAPTYALDVLSLVEAIVENPTVVLAKQRDRAVTARLAELKAEGVDYEDRLADIEGVDYPKPLGTFIYTTFNAFAERRPWLAGHTIRPKGVAREIVEANASFHQFVRDLGLARSEGVLLRYLSRVYKTLEKSVPDQHRSEQVGEVALFLRTLLGHTDMSLVDEWRALSGQATEAAPTVAQAPAVVAPPPPDPKTMVRMVRLHLHRVVSALASGDLEEAASWLLPADRDDVPPVAETLAAGLKAYLGVYPRLLADPASRHNHLTQTWDLPEGRWGVRQALCDPDGNDDWALEGEVALDDLAAERVPCIRLGRITG